MIYFEKVKEAAAYISNNSSYKPKIGVILGSGLGALGEEIEDCERYPYDKIPHFPVSTVEGHESTLLIGKIKNKEILAMKGRFHYYEGYPMDQVTFAIKVMKLLGIDTIIVTNAAGGISTTLNPGDLMMITDHINFSGINPLIGKNIDEFGVRFPDMSHAYDKNLITIAEDIAKEENISLQKGVYLYVTGPSYETPSEIKMFRTLGADAVGMSTVPEVIVAKHCNMKVMGISCITNMAAGILNQPLNHEEVIETSATAKAKFINLVKKIIGQL